MTELMWNGLDALAATLLHSLWQGALAALGLMLVLKCVPRSAANLRYGWGVAAMAALVAAMAITFLASFEPHAQAGDHVAATQAGLVAGALDPAVAAVSVPDLDEVVVSWQAWVVAGWLCGAVFFTLRLGGACWGVRQLRKTSLPIVDAELQHCFERVRARLGLSGSVILRASRVIESPLTLGWWKPVVLIPVSMTSALPPNHWEPIFAHELMHVRRCDFFFNLVMVGLRSALFYHPAVAWMVRQIQVEREAACDGQVVRTTGYRSRVSYASALLAVDEWRRRFRNDLGASADGLSLAMADGGGLVDRVERLAKTEVNDREVSRASKLPYGVALMLALLAATAGWMLGPSASGSGHGKEGGIVSGGIHIVPHPGEDVPPMADIVTAENIWDQTHPQLFASRLVLQAGDRTVPFGPGDPPLFEGIDNAWVLEHGLNYLDGQLPFRDPDGDGFTNREEYGDGTSPVLADEHPPLIGKLRFIERRQQLYRVKFAALPDGRSVQLNRLPTVNWPRKTFILRTGERTSDGQVEVLEIDGEVQLRHIPSGQQMSLTKGEVGTFSIDFAQLHLAVGDNDPFLVEVGDGFRLDVYSGEWRLESVAEKSAMVRHVGSQEGMQIRP